MFHCRITNSHARNNNSNLLCYVRLYLPISDGVEYSTSEYEYEYEYRKKLRVRVRVRVLILKNVLEYEYRKKVRVRVRVLLQV